MAQALNKAPFAVLAFVLALIAAAFAYSTPAHAQAHYVEQATAAQTGVSGEVLIDADGLLVPATMTAQGHDEGKFYNQAKLGLAVTWGTSTDFDGRCYEGPESNGPWSLMAICTPGTKNDCKPKVWNWTAANWPLGAINLRLPVTDRWYYCEFWHTGAGTGSITVTGAKSRQ